MELAKITVEAGPEKKRRRVARGRGSGRGKTSGRGQKGLGSRAGGGMRRLTEGGQMPFFRRLPKRGFSNSTFRVAYDVVNVGDLDEVFRSGDEVTKQSLVEAGLVRNVDVRVKILGDGEVSKKLSVQADRFSRQAREKITAAGGSVKEKTGRG